MSFRKLSDSFFHSCTAGIHKPFIDRVQRDTLIDFQIRDNFVNLYYRGANLLKLTDKSADFDVKYLNVYNDVLPAPLKGLSFPIKLLTIEDSQLCISLIPYLKESIDFMLADKEKCEREFQQLISRENNYSPVSSDTDYLICDIEYTHSDYRELRFDLIAAKWPSIGAVRKTPENMRLAIIEKKYGDGALTGSAGIQKHIADLINLAKGGHVQILKDEMVEVMKLKASLKLIRKSELDREDRTHRIGFTNEKPQWILLVANHKPESTILKRELQAVKSIVDQYDDFPFEILIATANYMGYGLYEKAMIPLDEFISRT